MKFKLFSIVATFLLSGSSLLAETLLVHVSGMVCGFCAQGIEARFNKVDGVENIKVDLGEKLVTVQTKNSVRLTDEQVKKIVEEAGYATVSIERK